MDLFPARGDGDRHELREHLRAISVSLQSTSVACLKSRRRRTEGRVKLSRPNGRGGRTYLSYKFLVYTVMAVFFATCALNTVMGTMWALANVSEGQAKGWPRVLPGVPATRGEAPAGREQR